MILGDLGKLNNNLDSRIYTQQPYNGRQVYEEISKFRL